MPKRSNKRPTQKDTQPLARQVLDAIVPDAAPTKPAANKAKPPKPAKKQDVKDIDQADSEGMAQPQGLTANPKKNPAAVVTGRLGGLKGGQARAEKLSATKRKEIAKKAAAKRSAKNRESEAQ
ncbi:MAG: hypothetical protein ABI614_28600 [Planctomycetota bacterium]